MLAELVNENQPMESRGGYHSALETNPYSAW